MLLTEHHFEFPSLKGDCTGSSESTLVKMPHCWKSHVAAQIRNPHGIQWELPFKGPSAFKIACRILLFPYTRFRTLTIYNVFFEQNKMAEGGIRNTTTGHSVGVTCFYSHKGPSWVHV